VPFQRRTAPDVFGVVAYVVAALAASRQNLHHRHEGDKVGYAGVSVSSSSRARIGSILIPGPIVDDRVTDKK